MRHGDPLSPFPFAIVVDVLSCLVLGAISKGFFKGLFIDSDGILVSYLQFVDDTIFFLEQDVDFFVNILSILKFLEVIYGLKINLPKKVLVGINVDSHIFTVFVTSVGCQIIEWPFTYLWHSSRR